MGPSLAPTHEPSVCLLCSVLPLPHHQKPSLGMVQDHNCFKCLYMSRLMHAVCPSCWRTPVHFCVRYITTYTGYSTFRQVATGARAMPMKCITNGLKEHIPLRHGPEWQRGTCLQQPGEILHSPMRTPQRQHLLLWLLSRASTALNTVHDLSVKARTK